MKKMPSCVHSFLFFSVKLDFDGDSIYSLAFVEFLVNSVITEYYLKIKNYSLFFTLQYFAYFLYNFRLLPF